MVHLQKVEEQLKAIGCNFRFFGRPEIRELSKILLPGETIAQCTNGYYEGGIALLVVTDHRLLLVDRKFMFLTIEDLRFDMIAEIDFNYRLLNSTIRIFSTNKTLMFTTWNHVRLRNLAEYLQHQVVKIRQQQTQAMIQAQFANPQQPTALPQAQPQLPAITDTETEPQQQTAPSMAQVAMEGSGAGSMNVANPLPISRRPSNSYTKIPLLARKRKFPRFY